MGHLLNAFQTTESSAILDLAAVDLKLNLVPDYPS